MSDVNRDISLSSTCNSEGYAGLGVGEHFKYTAHTNSVVAPQTFTIGPSS